MVIKNLNLIQVCGEKEFPVHRFILSARSPDFKATFSHDETDEGKTGRVIIKDLEPETLEILIKFAYTGQVDYNDLTIELLSAADKYNIQTLFKKCEMKLIENISVPNAAESFLAAYLHQANALKDVATKFIVENYEEVKKTSEMNLIIQQHPRALLEIIEAFNLFCSKQKKEDSGSDFNLVQFVLILGL